jgi:hypothetical protein
MFRGNFSNEREIDFSVEIFSFPQMNLNDEKPYHYALSD